MTDPLPKGWRITTIQDVAGEGGIVTDGDWVESKDQDPKGKVRLIQLADVGDGQFLNRSSRFMTKEAAQRLQCTFLKPGDLLVARMPDPLGRACIFPGLQQPAVTAVDVLIWRGGHKSADARWLMHVINSPEVRDQLAALAGGTTRQRVSGGNIKRLEIPVPPLAEQRRIVAQIEALFARTRRARTDLERIAALSRRHRDRILVNAFDTGQPSPILELASSIFDGPFGSNLKSDDYTKHGTRVVRLENIGHLRFIGEKETFISDAKADGLRRHLLKPHDVLFSSFIDEEVRVCLLPEDLSTSAINKADCFCVRIDAARADPRYVALRLASPTTYENMRDAVHGATRPRIGITDLKRYTINVPSIAEQQAIAMRVERQHTMSRLIETEAARTLSLLDRLEQSILARAFRGELVPQDADDVVELVSHVAVDQDAPTTRRRKIRAVAA